MENCKEKIEKLEYTEKNITNIIFEIHNYYVTFFDKSTLENMIEQKLHEKIQLEENSIFKIQYERTGINSSLINVKIIHDNIDYSILDYKNEMRKIKLNNIYEKFK